MLRRGTRRQLSELQRAHRKTLWRKERKTRTVVTAAERKSAGAAFFSRECSGYTQVLCVFPDCYIGSSWKRWKRLSRAPENTKDSFPNVSDVHFGGTDISDILQTEHKTETVIHPSFLLLSRWIQVVPEEAALNSLPPHRQCAPPVGQRLGPPSPLQAPPELPGDPATQDSAHRPQAVWPQHPLSPQPKPSDAQGEVGGSVTSVSPFTLLGPKFASAPKPNVKMNPGANRRSFRRSEGSYFDCCSLKHVQWVIHYKFKLMIVFLSIESTKGWGRSALTYSGIAVWKQELSCGDIFFFLIGHCTHLSPPTAAAA